MNQKRLRDFYNYVVSVKARGFSYSQFFADDDNGNHPWWKGGKWDGKQGCGTVGCLAGLGVLKYKLKRDIPNQVITPADAMAEYLELSGAEKSFLFFANAFRAKYKHALMRLKHLIQGGKPTGYNWEQEQS